jgi:S-(hydroxymethyl)glutathione dehydrogenase/alcohol dehydrogenase
MKAAVFREANAPLRIEDVEIDAPGPNEVLIKTVATGVCHSDLHYVDGYFPTAYLSGSSESFAGAVLGHEGAGIVSAVGDRVSYVQPGDHVVVCLSSFCGQCAECLTGHPNRCRWSNPISTRDSSLRPRLEQDGVRIEQLMDIASFAEQMLVHENSVVKVAEDLSLEHAALLSCGVLTGVGAVLNTAKVPPSAWVAVFGCGGVGLSVIQGAQLASAGRIIAVDIVEKKLEMALTLGATDVVNAENSDAVAEILSLTSGRGVDYAFDALGSVKLTQQAVATLAFGGTATIVGSMSPNQTLELNANALSVERRLQTSNMGSNRFRIDIPNYLEFYRRKKLRLYLLMSHALGLEDVNGAFELMRSGESIRSVLVFD